jgi:hypothetical protein
LSVARVAVSRTGKEDTLMVTGSVRSTDRCIHFRVVSLLVSPYVVQQSVCGLEKLSDLDLHAAEIPREIKAYTRRPLWHPKTHAFFSEPDVSVLITSLERSRISPLRSYWALPCREQFTSLCTSTFSMGDCFEYGFGGHAVRKAVNACMVTQLYAVFSIYPETIFYFTMVISAVLLVPIAAVSFAQIVALSRTQCSRLPAQVS